MPYVRTVDELGLVRTTLSGLVTLNDFIELEKTLPDYAQDDYVYEMVIHAEGASVLMDRAETAVSAAFLKNIVQGSLHAAVAFVSSDPLVFGLCRQLQLRVDNPYFDAATFTGEDEARAWLKAKQQAGRDARKTQAPA